MFTVAGDIGPRQTRSVRLKLYHAVRVAEEVQCVRKVAVHAIKGVRSDVHERL
jgi:hypothetical protein